MTKLETPVFQDDLDKKTLDNLLEMLDHIKINYVSRQEYNDKKGNILEKTGEQDNLRDFYNLYLPSDLKVGELASIIRKVNKLTFKDKFPDYSSTQELKVKVVYVFDYLTKKLKKQIDESSKVEIQKALKKYYLLYVSLFEEGTGGREGNKLNDETYRKSILDKDKSFKQKEFEASFIKRKTKVGQLQLKDELSDIEELVSTDLLNQFDESFFEKSVNDLRTGLEILSQAEHEKILAYIETENKGKNPFEKEVLDGIIIFRRSITSNGKLTAESIAIRNQAFYQEAKKLRDRIGVDKLKEELEKLRKTGNKEKVEEKELEIVNIIIKEIENGFQKPLQN